MRIGRETKLKNGKKLLAWCANNRGRGRDNCTLKVVDAADVRLPKSRNQECYETTRTSSWMGDVNLSRRVLKRLGIMKGDLIV